MYNKTVFLKIFTMNQGSRHFCAKIYFHVAWCYLARLFTLGLIHHEASILRLLFLPSSTFFVT